MTDIEMVEALNQFGKTCGLCGPYPGQGPMTDVEMVEALNQFGKT